MKKTISKQKPARKTNGSSQYDKVIKEALRRSLPVLMTEILGLPGGQTINHLKQQPLPTC